MKTKKQILEKLKSDRQEALKDLKLFSQDLVSLIENDEVEESMETLSQAQATLGIYVYIVSTILDIENGE